MGDTADTVSAVVNAGKSAWDIIRDGRAVSTATSSYCSALPKDIPFNELYGWKTKTGTWDILYENFYGWDVIECKMKLSFQYGGKCDKFPDCTFVTNFCVHSMNCAVSWGITFNVNATVKGKPYNAGSRTKVIGAIPVLVAWSATGVNNLSSSMELTAFGDGKLKS